MKSVENEILPIFLCTGHSNCYYYTSDSLGKIWLVESIQSIHNSLWTWHDKCNICCRYYIYHVSSTSAWLLSPLECSPQKQNGWMLRFCFWGWIMWKMYNKTIIIEFGFRMISWLIKPSCLCYLPSASADNTDLGFDNSWYHTQPCLLIDCCICFSSRSLHLILFLFFCFFWFMPFESCLTEINDFCLQGLNPKEWSHRHGPPPP